jgi:hypothetical protein
MPEGVTESGGGFSSICVLSSEGSANRSTLRKKHLRSSSQPRSNAQKETFRSDFARIRQNHANPPLDPLFSSVEESIGEVAVVVALLLSVVELFGEIIAANSD